MSREDSVETSWRRPGQLTAGRAPPLRADRTLQATLPSGRNVWLQIEPAPAPAAELNHFAQLVTRAEDRREAASLRQADTIGRLSRRLRADARRVGRRQLRGDRRLARRLLAGDLRLDARLSGLVVRQGREQRRILDQEAAFHQRAWRRHLWDTLVVASGLPLLAAFGQPGSPLAAPNLVLFLSQLVWLLGDDLTELLSGRADDTPHYLRGNDVWSYVAPFANLLTGIFLLGDRQSERFLTGFATLALVPPPADALAPVPGSRRGYRYRRQIDLGERIGSDSLPDFETFRRVPVAASLASLAFAPKLDPAAGARIDRLAARVRAGQLIVRVDASAIEPAAPAPALPADLLSRLVVAWMVDTKEPDGDR